MFSIFYLENEALIFIWCCVYSIDRIFFNFEDLEFYELDVIVLCIFVLEVLKKLCINGNLYWVISNVKIIVENDIVFFWFKKKKMFGNITLFIVSLVGIFIIVIVINFRKKKSFGLRFCVFVSLIIVY